MLDAWDPPRDLPRLFFVQRLIYTEMLYHFYLGGICLFLQGAQFRCNRWSKRRQCKDNWDPKRVSVRLPIVPDFWGSRSPEATLIISKPEF